MPAEKRVVKKKARKEPAGNSEFLDERTSQKILKIVAVQQQEEENESRLPVDTIGATRQEASDDEVSSNGEEEEDMDEYNALLEIQLDPEQLAVMDKFMHVEPSHLSNTIADKIAAAERLNASRSPASTALNEKVVLVYNKVGLLLSRYKSGKLPKTFKIIPSLPNWFDILMLTDPENWTPHATYEATKLFTSNLKTDGVVKFFSLILLERVRADIYENKYFPRTYTSRNLNYHLYMALKKAFYKPAAFFKGIIVPLCTEGGCTLREAVIIGSIVSKTSIPMLHSAACLLKIAELPYTGANSLFIRVLLDKKYALPFRVIDALVFHYLACKHDTRGDMPVLWHQSLLVFCQRYKEDMTREQKDSLLALVKVQFHKDITVECRRELAGGVERGGEESMVLDQ